MPRTRPRVIAFRPKASPPYARSSLLARPVAAVRTRTQPVSPATRYAWAIPKSFPSVDTRSARCTRYTRHRTGDQSRFAPCDDEHRPGLSHKGSTDASAETWDGMIAVNGRDGAPRPVAIVAQHAHPSNSRISWFTYAEMLGFTRDGLPDRPLRSRRYRSYEQSRRRAVPPKRRRVVGYESSTRS
jgi:hypothetical protein